MRSVRARGAVVAGLVALSLVAGACSGSEEPDDDPSPSPSTSATDSTEPMSFGVLGPAEERPAWEQAVEGWNEDSPRREVQLVEDFDHDRLLEQITAGQVPDVFVARRSDLEVLAGADLVEPVGELLDARGVDFGDGYARDALQLFSAEDDLQCMPLSASPLVMYVNTDLFDVETMASRDIDVPASETTWTFDQMAAVAQFATRPRRGIRGIYVDPTVRGLAPYVLSAGGSVFDSEEEPTGLDFSGDESASGIEQLLQLVRSPEVSPTPEEIDAAGGARALFKSGRLAMLAGYRSLTPELREQADLAFDVREMPFLGTDATLGQSTGLCLAEATNDVDVAADFLVHLLQPENLARLTRAGYSVPASLEVARSGAFLQRTRRPQHAEVFLDAVRDITPLPTVDYQALDAAVGPLVRRLFESPVINLSGLLERIDLRSRELLDPEFDPDEGEDAEDLSSSESPEEPSGE